MSAPFPGPFGNPPDEPSIVAAVVALLLVWQGRAAFRAMARAPRGVVAGVLALAAAALSAGYVFAYLRGGPRIIDATSYWLQAKALAEGHVTWPIDEPTASVRGRFLLTSGSSADPRLSVIFPPGYPAILALGFLLRAPLAVGPAIAFLLVIGTYVLALRVSRRADVACLAACLSVLCAALRYHTADTMSHGWAALLVVISFAAAFHTSDTGVTRERAWGAALAGLAFGWLVATRPISACAVVVPLGFALRRLRRRDLGFALGGAIVPIALFVVEQRLATGTFFLSTQTAYYAVADGPPGCFRYGFGAGIGCQHEHGAYVDAVLPRGFGWSAATMTTLRRLRLHFIDVANAEPLTALIVLAPFLAFRARRTHSVDAERVGALLTAIVAIILAYVPFYFDGSYPGGGARFFADALALEHVLVAVAVALLAERAPLPFLDFPLGAALTLSISLAGFAFHASYEHLALRDREGGRPFFEPSVLKTAKIDRGLLFVGTDHAFNLAYDPDARDAWQKLVVAREYGDDRDRMVWERLGKPPSHRYVFDGRESLPVVVAWSPPTPSLPFRFEAEAEWPAVAQSGGFFEPTFAQGSCAWGGRLLAVRTRVDQPFHGTISFPVPRPGRFRIAVHVASQGFTVARIALRAVPDGPPLATWAFAPSRKSDLTCATLLEQEVNLTGHGWLDVSAKAGSGLAIDAIALEPAGPLIDTR
ncbi:MAG TPA: hypothetical protein VJT73_18185 [Polyangiaceae bacterium]|nr:hypothetical protein [Polyangiaceae bacterium]